MNMELRSMVVKTSLKSLFVFLASAFLFTPISHAQKGVFPALSVPAEREVDIAWNRFYDTEGIEDNLRKIHRAFPNLTELYSIGESYEGREIWCLEVSSKKVGNLERKPGMYIDGNIHGNEVQAAEVVMYTAWYLTENYGRIDRITQLLDQKVFYLIPTINPDGRDHWFHEANTPHSSRTGKKPLDNDRDGLVDEDGYDDLNGDGHISVMRIKDPNGRYILHSEYPDYLMERVDEDQRGEYRIVGYEGVDNDGDGEINEDGPGGYDSNRNWAYDWQPNYVQYGAHDYPFSLPNTRAVAEFVKSHPNIAGMQSYHNTGGMILRPPGREGGVHQPEDDRLMQDIAARGETMLPEYRSMVVATDLYTVWGGEFDWFYGAEGILSYTNELWTLKNMFRSNRQNQEARVEFSLHLLFDEGLVKWEEVEHPTYGTIEVGGFTKEQGRVPPSFLLEEECHRNMAFTLYHADQMPSIEFVETKVEELEDGLYKIWVEIRNNRMIPTRLQQDVKNNISPPDLVTLTGPDIEVLSSGIVTDRYFNRVAPIKVRPQRIQLETIDGMNSEWVQFIVSGNGTLTVKVDSTKGGVMEKEITLP